MATKMVAAWSADLYYLWHVRMLSNKPCLHTQLPEHNVEATEKFPGGGGIWSTRMDLWWGIWTTFWSREGGIFQKFSENSKLCLREGGGKFKLRFDWYIICQWICWTSSWCDSNYRLNRLISDTDLCLVARMFQPFRRKITYAPINVKLLGAGGGGRLGIGRAFVDYQNSN